MALSDKTEIFVHCTATRKDWLANAGAEAKRDEIRRWHIEERGWRDIGYAAIIDRDGTVAWGRDLDKDGDYFEETAAAARGHNKTGVHVALVGGFGGEANDKFSKHFTAQQDAALRSLVAAIKTATGRDNMRVRGHNEVANKACPCFQVAPWYAVSKPRAVSGSTTLQATAAVGLATGTSMVAMASDTPVTAAVVIGAGFVALVGLAIIFRERLKMWARGVR